MVKFIRRLLAPECCTEFTQWETRQVDFERPVTYEDVVCDLMITSIVFTKRWQERRCVVCGKLEQRKLKF